jgi:hypothetical protein
MLVDFPIAVLILNMSSSILTQQQQKIDAPTSMKQEKRKWKLIRRFIFVLSEIEEENMKREKLAAIIFRLIEE